MNSGIYLIIACALSITFGIDQNIEEEEILARAFLDELNDELNEHKNQLTIAEWNFNSNITKENQEIKDVVAANNAEFLKEKAKEIITKFNFKTYKDEDLKRQFNELTKLGYAALPSEKFKILNDALNAMQTNYARVHVCSYQNKTNCDLQLEPGMINMM